MKMDTKVIGFIGIEKYDILLYLSRILYHLDKKVLLTDYSQNQALSYCIPLPAKAGEICSVHEVSSSGPVQLTVSNCEDMVGYYRQRDTIVWYRGIDFLLSKEKMGFESQIGEYDFILVDFGMMPDPAILEHCNQVFFCVDQQLHHIRALRQFSNVNPDKSYLMIKKVLDCRIAIPYILCETKLKISESNIFEYYADSIDMRYRINSQYRSQIQFGGISKSLKICLKKMAQVMTPDLTASSLNIAYRNARLGR